MTETAQIFYDADAEQRVGLTLKSVAPSGATRKHKVAHVFRAMTDEDFFKYEELKRVVQKISGTDVLSIRTEDNNLRATEWLWNTLAVRREGYVEREDWKEKTNLLDKQTAIEKGLLAVFVAEESDSDDPFADSAAQTDDAAFDDDFSDEVSTLVRLDCLFDEQPLTVAHYFNQPTAADVADYEKTMRRASNLVNSRRGFRQKKNQQRAQISIPSKAKELCALYDRLVVNTEGYAGRVPGHHKREAALELFAREVEVTEKN